MGVLDAFLQAAPGLYAQAKAGQQAGFDRRREELRQRDADQRAAEQAALQQMILQSRMKEDQETAPYRRRLLEAQTGEAEGRAADFAAQVAGTGRYAPKPEAPRNIDPLSSEGIKARKDLARYEAGLKPVPGVGGSPGKILPASAVSDLSDWQGMLDATREARGAFNDLKGANATGAFVGRFGGLLGQFGHPPGGEAGVRANSRLSNITTALGKLRSGGAITPQEFERLVGLLPQKTDDEETVIKPKLAELEDYVGRVIQRKLDGFEEAGYGVQGVRQSYAAPSGTMRPTAPKPTQGTSLADQWEALVASGMSPAEATARLQGKP